ncbi:hypothetical protein E4U42_003646 [Claviceps africana]|uniref:Ras guanine-nucleotide exchange protein Cdc25p n=1 Tax=Claviceps africana TaxID=83212 RepID=A0A8K0NIP8_9HYPO|nr:hypothetical protein E4U42_003646 [Claviceps africana]
MLRDVSLEVNTRATHISPSYEQPHADSYGFHESDQHTTSHLDSQMTPPTTPDGSQENLSSDLTAPPIFHNFLRAFYPFHPGYTASDASVTLPLEEGDVVLVHSVHTNGWADGTLLASGARGWLPTNYCDAYEPDDIRNLLKALLNFWDLLRSTSVNDSKIFANQEFMKGIIAGVRFLLERTACLSRESTVIQRSEGLRKGRKSLLSELSSLVKAGKRLQESQNGISSYDLEDANDIIDEMILRAFRIVTKGVRFLDILEEERRARVPASVTVMATVAEESYVPPTPPADRSAFDDHKHEDSNEAASRTIATDEAASNIADAAPSDSQESARGSQGLWSKRGSSLNALVLPNPLSPSNQNRNSQGSFQTHRLSSGMSHRVSLAGPSPLSSPQYLVSERLNRSHDKFLSHLGSFIGRLHLQSQSRPELSVAIKQSATSGGELLAVMDSVCLYNGSNVAVLHRVRTAMFERIHILVLSARDTLVNAATEGADLIMPQDNGILLMAATGCVRAAGECVAKTKAAIERIGDFELELDNFTLGIDLSILDVAEDRGTMLSVAENAEVASTPIISFDSCESSTMMSRRASESTSDKPLPRVPEVTTPVVNETTQGGPSPASSRPSSEHEDNASSVASSVSSMPPALPPLPKLITSLDPSEDFKRVMDMSAIEQDQHVSHFDCLTASSAGSSGTYLSRDSEISVVSQSSTRATTPEHFLAPRNQPSFSSLSAQAEEQDDVETRLLEKTFAHELMFNKEGQVTGGSLPALIERLTTHESTPDATFVSTFFLTFRLFCRPLKLAEALMERFDYVGEFQQMAGPVRLRVYNAFKGWLESHWRDETDREALKLIIPFAESKLMSVLPSAGRRLLELATRVSGDGSLVPRLVSSMGKTNTAIGHFIPADTPMPAPMISKSQQHLLTSFRNGGNGPTILEIEPLELARQLTIKQMGIFCSIMPEELLASQWMKKGGVDAPNVKAMSALSTDISNMVAETILHYPEIKKRALVIKQWIKVAQLCLELHNYDGLMAIICSLNSSTINRLRKTWDAISSRRKETLRHLQEIVEPAQNNKVLRTRLHDHVPPCLPFLGMYLTDLTFVDIGNPATKQMSMGIDCEEDGSGGLTVINFDKHTRTAKIVGELQRFQIPYRLVEVPDLQDWISAQIRRVREGDHGNVQVTYYRKSLLLEPRESTARRELETPTPVTSNMGAYRGDLFGWMTRDRSQSTTAA